MGCSNEVGSRRSSAQGCPLQLQCFNADVRAVLLGLAWGRFEQDQVDLGLAGESYTRGVTSNVDVAHRIGPGLWWTARSILFVVSIAALLSFGAQIYFLPFLIPAQWLAARHSHRVGHALFTLLAALLVAEVGWMIGYELAAGWAVPLGVMAGTIIGALFFRTSDRRT